MEDLEKQNLKLRKIIQQNEDLKQGKIDEKSKQGLKIKFGKYRIKSNKYGTFLRANLFWIVDLTANSGKCKEWIISENNRHVSIRSWANTYLSGNPEGKVGVQNSAGPWQQWEIIPKSNFFYIKPARGTFLRGNVKGHVKLTQNPGQQQWKLIS